MIHRLFPTVPVFAGAKMKEFPSVTGDVDLIKSVWENIDALGNVYMC